MTGLKHSGIAGLLAAILVLISQASAQIVGFDPSNRIESEDDLFVFVGKLVQIEYEERPTVSESPDHHVIIVMDGKYNVRVEVLQQLHGSFVEDTIDFNAYDHYGTPNFTNSEFFVMYLRQYDDGLVHVKYTYDEVFPLAGGGFGGCGDPYDGLTTEELARVKPQPLQTFDYQVTPSFNARDFYDTLSDYNFANATPERLAEIKAEIERENAEIDRYLSPPNFRRVGDEAFCLKGATAYELFRINYRIRDDMLARHYQTSCKKQFGLDDDTELEVGSPEAVLVADCIDLKISN